ncbi:hypothetical protein CAPTEDRAFT_222417 [Capitella teleta]|uniref:Cadherin domain-containing protein n=1 Tax=Capitella teleta TaxID=283909 RepID=R7TEM9_CAPTE|nr:hypothetical protein CAPTEDRAFT_222417 [Capitella teleta]|eukprot:ELT89521.1 hypothetical protein CAPTEDRAFT_222417 [Capitella teleta]
MDYRHPILALLVVTLLSDSVAETPDMEFEVEEESPAYTFVGDIEQFVRQIYDEEIVNVLSFGFLNQPHKDATYFELENDPAVLRTARSIDREVLCPTMHDCFLDIDIAIVRPIEYFRMFSVRVWILDINDNIPVFPEVTYPVSMSESSSVGTSISLPVAMDLDSPENGIKGYRLISESFEFDLKSTTQAGGQIDLHLKLMTALDRELVEEYELDVEVYDGGSLSSTVNIVVTVEDANDHSPVFPNSTLQVTVPENYPTDQGFFVVEATDEDTGDNGRVSYRFAPRTQSTYGKTFGLHESSGAVFLKETLDWVKKQEYELDIVATDGGPDSRSAQCSLVVKVQDVNDNKPLVSINTLTEHPEARILENSPRSTFVAHVSVFDSDEGPNGEVVCELSNTEDFYLNNIGKNQYKIETSYILDRETTPRYLLIIACQDLGTNPLRSSANLTVLVMDENDHSPEFTQSVYTAVLPENNEPDAYIMQLNATDLDMGDNSKIHYEIVESLTQYVYIIPNKGVVRASDRFDYETTKKLQFTVRARDGASPPRSSTARVTITILDLNDQPPIFTKPQYDLSVKENQLKYYPVGHVSASDRDSGSFNRFVFSLLNDGHSGTFAIDPDSGEIKTLQVLDREDRDIYYITAIATDLDQPLLSSSCMVVIKVEDVNDNFPVIEYPTRENNSFSISNRVPRGHEIIKVFASDADQGLNAMLSYYIDSGNYNQAFMINVTSGMLSTKGTFEGVSYEAYEITLKVNDHGRPPRSATMVLQIIVDELTPYYASPREKQAGGSAKSNNLTIIIIVAAVSGFIMVILIIAIVAMKVYDRRRPTSVYKCRVEEEKILRKAAILDHDVRISRENEICPSPSSTGRKHMQMESPHMQQRQTDMRNGNASWGSRDGRAHTHDYPISTTAPDQHLEAHLLALLKQDKGDTESASSAEVSNADSGRGGSEEGGEQNYHSASRHAYPSNYGGCQTFSSKGTHPPSSSSHSQRSKGHHSKRETPENQIPPKSAIIHKNTTPQPTSRGSIHCLVREEQERRGRDQSPNATSSPKKVLTTFQSPPSYETVVQDGVALHESDETLNNKSNADPSLHNIAEEEDCDFDVSGENGVDPQEICQEIDNLFFKSVVV